MLVGTSHPREEDLSGLNIDVTKIYGTKDGLASPEEVAQYSHLLPVSTRWVRIEGGNHAQFGWYGSQLGDHDARISREEQQRLLIGALLEALDRARGSD